MSKAIYVYQLKRWLLKGPEAAFLIQFFPPNSVVSAL